MAAPVRNVSVSRKGEPGFRPEMRRIEWQDRLCESAKRETGLETQSTGSVTATGDFSFKAIAAIVLTRRDMRCPQSAPDAIAY